MYPRFVEPRIRNALADTRVVLLSGPRQSGKTTLGRKLADGGMTYMTLDNATVLDAARGDPVGFVRGLDRAVIDEVQRAPGLMLALKESVDADRRPGRFLLTGSADLMALPRVADSLAGRMEVMRLFPLAQCELRGASSSFLSAAFAGEVSGVAEAAIGNGLVEAVLAGGYPEALTRRSWARRQDWYAGYVEAIVQRDVRDVAHVDQLQQMPKLLRVLGEHAGQLVNYSGIGAALGMNHVTTQKYVGVFERLFLVRTLPSWHSNQLKRLTRTPKLHFLDAGLLAALRDLTPDRLRADRTPFGALLETFVFAELLKLASWAEGRLEFSHFRDKGQHEVDIVIEDRQGRVVGIEVKAAATVTGSDFSGLRKLAEACGNRFVLGLVLYDHDKAVPFGDRLAAAPLAALWS
jgi:predicted AAA+ superfamily ATPase